LCGGFSSQPDDALEVNCLALTAAVNVYRGASTIGRDFGGIHDQETGWHIHAAGALLAFTAPAAHAAPPETFTITGALDFEAGVFTFTATSPLCPSGTFEDEVHAFGGANSPNPKANFQIRTVYICDNGDTFFAQKHVFAAFNENGSSTSTGPITLKGGTGEFTRLSGHGVNIGAVDPAGMGVGNISGVLKLG
jgi:hypothetical protein